MCSVHHGIFVDLLAYENNCKGLNPKMEIALCYVNITNTVISLLILLREFYDSSSGYCCSLSPYYVEFIFVIDVCVNNGTCFVL